MIFWLTGPILYTQRVRDNPLYVMPQTYTHAQTHRDKTTQHPNLFTQTDTHTQTDNTTQHPNIVQPLLQMERNLSQ